jgi:pimeloyl-ACP methyl ester carboxylesterase
MDEQRTLENTQKSSGEVSLMTEDLAGLKARLEADRVTEVERNGEAVVGGEVVRYVPEFIRKDEATGEPATPLLFVRGMGAAEADEWYLKEIAELDQRPVVGVTYKGRFRTTAREAEVEGLDGKVSEIDVKEADDLARALGALGIARVDVMAESRGAIAAVLFMRNHPGMVKDAVLEHPAGQNRHSFRQRHVDAARERIARVIRGRDQGAQNALPEEVSGERRDSWITRMRNSRTEQKSVARAQLDVELGKLSPDIHVIVTGDTYDKAFRPKDLRETVRRASEVGASVEFEETHWGGHGFRYDLVALGESVTRLRRLERRRKID